MELFREHTTDVWYDRTEAELLGPEARCGKCGGGEFRKETDILDVWFDSGSSHLAVLNETYGLPWPCDIYVEGPRSVPRAGSRARCWWAWG